MFWISAPLTIKCRSLPYNIAIVDARPGVNDCYLLTVLSVLYLINSPSISLSASSKQFLSGSLDFLKPLQAYLLLYPEPEVLKIFILKCGLLSRSFIKHHSLSIVIFKAHEINSFAVSGIHHYRQNLYLLKKFVKISLSFSRDFDFRSP